MKKEQQAPEEWLLVERRSLPEVFGRVLEAKRLLASGKAETAAEAARTAGISRSAFYKYKDAVYPYSEKRDERLISVNLRLHDRTGALSDVMAVFADAGTSIRTINQSAPSGGAAMVTVSAYTADMRVPEERLLHALQGLTDVEEISGVIHSDGDGAARQEKEEETI